MRLFLRQITRSDPTTFVATFGVWSSICGMSLLLPGSGFNSSPVWNSIRAVYADEQVWGAVMLADGLLLLASIRMRKVPQRAAISAFSAVMWFLLGSSMVIDAYKHGFYSIVGAYAIWGSICCIFAVEQWVNYPLGSDTHGVR